MTHLEDPMDNEEKRDQEELDELQDFDLDAILNEFHTDPEDAPPEDAPGIAPETGDIEAFDQELSQILQDFGEEPGEEQPASLSETRIFSQAPSDAEKTAAAPGTEQTIRIEEPLAAAAEEAAEPETAAPAQEPIPFRSDLRELKRKLIAGPEKRYYELSDQGVFSLQIAIVLNLLVVAFCAGSAVMFSMGMVPDNRLRFVIFTQVLAMFISALLGCHQLLDGLGELLHGRFTINTFLSFTLIACCVDAYYCLQELRVPCCSGFALQMTFALFGRYHRRSTETLQMDTLRKATHLRSIVKEKDYIDGKPVLLRGEGDVDDFTNTYTKASAPETIQSIYCLLAMAACIGLAVLAGMRYNESLAFQVLSISLFAAVPASFFVSLTRPTAILENRLHMVGSVLCGWQGVVGLRGKACFPLKDEDLFPLGSTKLNGVKFYGDREPEQILSYASSLIGASGGGLVPLFRNMLKNRGGSEYPVTEFRDYGVGGVGGIIRGEAVLLGSLDFLQSMDVDIPQGTTVAQAVYMAINGKLSAVVAISYAKMRSTSAGLTSLNGSRKLQPVMLTDDFMLTAEFLHSKFSVNTRRMIFPDRATKAALSQRHPDPEDKVLALATRDELVSLVYPVTGANALRKACALGLIVHILGGIVGLLIMFALAFQGSVEILTPEKVFLYQLIWMVPGLLVTEWARTV